MPFAVPTSTLRPFIDDRDGDQVIFATIRDILNGPSLFRCAGQLERASDGFLRSKLRESFDPPLSAALVEHPTSTSRGFRAKREQHLTAGGEASPPLKCASSLPQRTLVPVRQEAQAPIHVDVTLLQSGTLSLESVNHFARGQIK